jgi:hypothetical protein
MQFRNLTIHLAAVGNRSVSPWSEKGSDFGRQTTFFGYKLHEFGTRS